jgi:hypothetical protein
VAAGALAAIAGLWFQAVATYWSQQTAKDQLSQSKEDSATKAREQASKVGYWVAVPREDGNTSSLHVANRSPDPVTEVSILVAAAWDTDGRSLGLWNLSIGTMEPCSEYVFSLTDLKLSPWRDVGEKERKYSVSGGASIEWLHLRDMNGKPWIRTHNGLRPSPEPAPLPGDGPAGVVSIGNQRVNTSTNCSTGTK